MADGPAAERLIDEVPSPEDIIVPTIVELEVAKWLGRESDPATRQTFLAFTGQCTVVPLDSTRALAAADVHRTFKLATADAIVYAAALEFDAQLLTCDRHFEALENVLYIPNK